MAQLDEREYLAMRLKYTEEMAERAMDPSVKQIHRQFAGQYAQRLADLQQLPLRAH